MMNKSPLSSLPLSRPLSRSSIADSRPAQLIHRVKTNRDSAAVIPPPEKDDESDWYAKLDTEER
jgi:hypothetical protein